MTILTTSKASVRLAHLSSLNEDPNDPKSCWATMRCGGKVKLAMSYADASRIWLKYEEAKEKK